MNWDTGQTSFESKTKTPIAKEIIWMFERANLWKYLLVWFEK